MPECPKCHHDAWIVCEVLGYGTKLCCKFCSYWTELPAHMQQEADGQRSLLEDDDDEV
jgi:hypothetical protein